VQQFARARANPGGTTLPADRGDKQYRSRLEILRDFLDATREGGKKTRIIGLANLNPSSFQSYLDYCVALRLIQDTPAGYRLTPRADIVLDAIERLLSRSAEVDAALLALQKGVEGAPTPGSPSKGALRYVSRLAWNEVVRSAQDSLGTEAELAKGGMSVDLRLLAYPTWSERADASDADAPALARELPPEPPPTPRPRSSRGRARG